MEKNRIGKTILLNVGLVIAVIMLGVGAFFATRAESGEAGDFVLTGEGVGAGDYVTADGAHKIGVATDEGGGTTIEYFNTAAPETTYMLTASTTTSAAGVETTTLTGKLGTDNKNATFVMLNDNAILCVSHIKYATASGNVVLCRYTPFVKTYTPTADANGVIEVWRNDAKVSAFANFQAAFSFAQNNDTIKLKSNFLASEGAALVGKTLTIDGGNYLLDKSQWANTVFAVAEDAQLTINNLDIDGGATNWAVDFDAVTFEGATIPLVAGSADNDPQTSYPAVTSKGELIANNLNISNIYSSTAEGIGLFVAKGKINISNSAFSHLASSIGGAMRIGCDIIEESLDSYPVESVVFNSVDFTNNYAAAWGGGAIYIGNIGEGSFEDCNFDTNAASGLNGGGAISMYTPDYAAYNLGLTYGKIDINNSIFNNNWAGRCGFAIYNRDVEFTITNTKFTGNIGAYRPDGAVATFFCRVNRSNYRFAVQIIKNCVFENNQGGVACIADNAGAADIRISDTQFKNNVGSSSTLLYTGVGEIDNCTFENEQVTGSVISVPMYNGDSRYENAGLTGPSLTIKDTTFTGTPDGVDDISMKKEEGRVDVATEPKIIIEGETKANISMEHGAELDVDGMLDGSVTCAVDTPSDTNVTVGTNGSITGGVVQYYNLTITYPNPDNDTESLTETITIAGGATSSHAIEMLLGVSKENHTLALYTDSACTIVWDYNCDGAETLYGKWEWSVTINYYDQGGVRFTGTHGAAFAQRHINGRKTIIDTPTKGGYIFDGWYLGDSTCSDESKRVTELSADVNYESISLYAKWRVFEQTITLTCQNFTTQQFMVYVFIGDDLVMQVKPTATTTITLSRLKNYDKTVRICFVYGYHGKIEYTSLTGAKANGRSVNVSLVENTQINYKITTPNVNASIIV